MFQLTWEAGYWVGLECDLIPSVKYLISQGYTPICEVYTGDGIEAMDQIQEELVEVDDCPF
jgi:hypothetical protein